MSRIYHIVNYLGYLAGFACVLMIAVAVYKILTGDEMEYRRYLTKESSSSLERKMKNPKLEPSGFSLCKHSRLIVILTLV